MGHVRPQASFVSRSMVSWLVSNWPGDPAAWSFKSWYMFTTHFPSQSGFLQSVCHEQACTSRRCFPGLLHEPVRRSVKCPLPQLAAGTAATARRRPHAATSKLLELISFTKVCTFLLLVPNERHCIQAARQTDVRYRQSNESIPPRRNHRGIMCHSRSRTCRRTLRSPWPSAPTLQCHFPCRRWEKKCNHRLWCTTTPDLVAG